MGWFKRNKQTGNEFTFDDGVKAFHDDPATEVIEQTAGSEFRTKRVAGRTVQMHAVVNPDMMLSGGFDAVSKEKAITIIFRKPYDQVMFTIDQIEPLVKQMLEMKKRLDGIDPEAELRKAQERN